MEWKVRQLRFDMLLQQRRKEDTALLRDGNAYVAPRGLSPNDSVYSRLREYYNDGLDDRARLAYREAKRFLRLKLPEIAYVEIESYMRLQPGMEQGKKVLAEIRSKMSNRLSVLQLQPGAMKPLPIEKRLSLQKHASKKQVVAAMNAGDLLKAQQLAQVYRRDGGADADKLLLQVQTKIDVQAGLLFAKGNSAFGQEKLDLAIGYWRGATVLRPEKSEYREALHRARQLQERLSLLRGQNQSSGQNAKSENGRDKNQASIKP